MTPLIEAFNKEHPPSHKKEYWQNELESLGIESKRQSELNDGDEREALAENIKQVYYQDYKSAYDEESGSKS
jgi:putative cell wall-binding protein